MNEEKIVSISIKEAAELAGVSKDTIRRNLKQGVLQGVLHKGKYGQEYRIYKDFFEQWLNSRGVHAYSALQEVLEGVPIAANSNTHGQQPFLQEVPMGDATGLPKVLEKLEQAMFRVGWLEGQLDLTKKLLTEGQDTIKQREENFIKEKVELEDKLKYKEELLIKEKEEKEKLKRELLFRGIPWWKKVFTSREEIEKEISKRLLEG